MRSKCAGLVEGQLRQGDLFVSFGGCGSIADHRLPRSRHSGRPGGLVSARGVVRGGLGEIDSGVKHEVILFLSWFFRVTSPI